jgi:peptidoglycan/xylan/chitin deacetylase (PgdA/CDA1 family)
MVRALTRGAGDSHSARWKDDQTAAFLLMFDDSWPSHWQVAVPELAKRNMIATFYICPGKGEYQKFAEEWEERLWKQGMVYGVHTMSHKGVKDYTNADW